MTSFSANTQAAEIETNNNFYQETGEVRLNRLNLYTENNKLTYSLQKATVLATEQKSILEQEIKKNPNFEDAIIDMMNDETFKGKTLVSIGYTRVYLKEQVNSGETHLQPMTVEEYKSTQKAPYQARYSSILGQNGNLTLYAVSKKNK